MNHHCYYFKMKQHDMRGDEKCTSSLSTCSIGLKTKFFSFVKFQVHFVLLVSKRTNTLCYYHQACNSWKEKSYQFFVVVVVDKSKFLSLAFKITRTHTKPPKEVVPLIVFINSIQFNWVQFSSVQKLFRLANGSWSVRQEQTNCLLDWFKLYQQVNNVKQLITINLLVLVLEKNQY